ncbi:MAG: adenosylcobinamide amidohydrolase [Methanospirillum sp.]|nr:adenosylcobinamide amidohydrolase [Methanospirillum sp.]
MDDELQSILVTSNGERAFRNESSILVKLPPGRAVLSTARVNGGYREDLEAVFNNKPSHHATKTHELEGGSIEAYLRITAERLGVDPEKTAGIMTAARMKHAAIVTRSFRGVEVTAIITGGIEVNGGRAGDPASYYQESGKIERLGTINTILVIGAHLPPPTMVRAVITAAEGKTVVLQQLMAPSRYSSGIATGSGTDGIIVITDTTHGITLTDAGKHSKLGELIGQCIIEATTETLKRQSDLTPLTQRDVMVRLDRFSVKEEDIWRRSCVMAGENRRPGFTASLREISREPALVGATAAVLHIHDEISWGLVPDTAGRNAAIKILLSFPPIMGTERFDELVVILSAEENVLENLLKTIAWITKQRALQN